MRIISFITLRIPPADVQEGPAPLAEGRWARPLQRARFFPRARPLATRGIPINFLDQQADDLAVRSRRTSRSASAQLLAPSRDPMNRYQHSRFDTAAGRLARVSILGILLCGLPSQMAAQAANAAHAHIGHVMHAFGPAPDGQGLLPTARQEAEIAIQHAAFAARDLFDLAAMQLHSRHVLHAVDPTAIESGPGLGFGAKRAAEGVVQHIEMAADSEGASDNVRTHAVHVAAAARTVAARAEEIAALAARIQAASNYDEAGSLVRQLQTLTEELLSGRDADGDGRIGWQEGEGGLDHAQQHMGLMMRGEGLEGGA